MITEMRKMEACRAGSEPEILTVGLLKELIGDRNIPAIQALVNGREDTDPINRLVDRDQYIAVKLWQEEDIKACLEEEGYKPTKQNVAKVLNTGKLDELEDCTDSEWEIIFQAIGNAGLHK